MVRLKWFLPVLTVALVAAVSVMAFLPPRVSITGEGTISIGLNYASANPGAIDIGPGAINRGSYASNGYTRVDLNNPANEPGIITSVQVWAYSSSMQNTVVGTFYNTGTDKYKCRDSEAIGMVFANRQETFTGLSIAVEEGDFLGIYWSTGYCETDTSGFAGMYRVSGEHIDPDDEATYTLYAGDALSIYGTSERLPSLVGITTDSASIRLPSQRNAFYAAGRFWVFYCLPGTNDLVYQTSTDGGHWDSAIEIGPLPIPNGANYDVFFDGTNIHYIRNLSVDVTRYTGINYKRGVPQSDGTITWSEDEQEVLDDEVVADDISLCVDSSGYPWVGYGAASFGTPTVIKSSTNDGTWSTAGGYPLELLSGVGWLVALVPQTSGKLCAVIYKSTSTADRIQARFYNGSSWEDIEYVTADGDLLSTSDFCMLSATSIGDEIHIVYHEDSATNLQYISGHHSSWSAETTLDSGIATATVPVIGKDGSNLYVFWLDDDDHVYYKIYNGASWENTVDWIDESSNTLTSERTIQCFAESYNDTIGVCYQTIPSTNYKVKFAFLDIEAGGDPDISNDPATWSIGTVATSADYWSSGSEPSWPLDDGECHFTVTNNGDTCSMTVKGTNFTGGVGWTLAGSPGANTVTMKAGKSGDALEANMITLTTSEQSFITGLAGSATKKWELMMESATGHTDGSLKSNTVTLTATLD